MSRRFVQLLFFAPALVLAACAGGGGPAQPTPQAGDDGPFEPYDEVLEETERHDGLFTMHVKRDLTLFMEIMPDQLDTDYGMMTHFSRGTGVYNLHAGLRVNGTRLIRWERHGDRLYLVERNARFTADEGSNMRASLEENTGHSILGAFDIEAEHDSTDALVIDVTSFFVGDFENLADGIGNYHGTNRVSFDGDRSYLDDVMVFPENVEIDALLTFEAAGPPTFSSGAGVSDYRSIPVGLRYSIFSLPQDPMPRRLADDRVGFFLSAQRDFSRDRNADPYVRYINRWRLEKANPNAAMSEPVEPIVYYVDRSVPEEYRQWVKEGIEAWNKAFEAAGFRNAVVAMDPPQDPEWNAQDVRYSTVIWTAAHEMGYAIGPSQVDPRTGEILNADILISSTFVTGWNAEWQELVGPVEAAARAPGAAFGGLWGGLMAVDAASRTMGPTARAQVCVAEMGKAHQLGLQHAALAALGVIDGTAPMPDDFLAAAVRDLIMHEVGHTLGLRHNFRGSSAVPFDRLNDEAFTRRNGVSVSVMDYNATNIASDPSRQGHYVNPEVGSYDMWAIEYGYTVIPGAGSPMAERARLAEIAARGSADPLLEYNTDEDTHLGPFAVDPVSNTWDLSADPLAFARDRARLVDRIQPEIEARMVDDGQGYQRLRGAVTGLIFERYGALVPVTKTIGGAYFHRDHKGQPEARMPFVPVDAARQRAALSLIIEQAFAPDAFHFEAGTLNRLPPPRWGDWSQPFISVPIDYPIHGYVATVQNVLLGQIMHNGRLIRMINNGVRMPGGAEPFTVAELFGMLTDGIWTEAGWGGRRATNVDSYRRNLQRLYVDQLIDKALDRMSGPPSPFNPSTPEDARSLARYELQRLSDRLGQVMDAGSLNRVTRAHFAESKTRIDQAMEADMIIEGS